MAQAHDISTEQYVPDEAPPEGFESQSGDLQGYWEAASQGSAKTEPNEGSPPVLFTPLFVTLTDNKREKEKSSTLIHARLEKPCLLRSAVKEEGYKVFPKGTLFGIWSKPTMKPLGNLRDIIVWMRNGVEVPGQPGLQKFKDIGKGSDMVLCDLRWNSKDVDAAQKEGRSLKLEIKDDRRVNSLPERLRQKRASDAQDTGDIPF